MKPFEIDMAHSSAAGAEFTMHFAAAGGLSLPYELVIPNEFNGFVLHFLRFVDAMFPEKRTLRNLTGGLCNRIWTLRGWVSWLLCATALLTFFGLSMHTMAWHLEDPQATAVRPSLYLCGISTIWIVEQTFCIFMRPLIPLRSMQGYIRNWSPINCYVPKLMCAFAFAVFAGNVGYGLFSSYSTLDIRDCIPELPNPYSSVVAEILNCTTRRDVSKEHTNNLLSIVGGFGQQISRVPQTSIFLSFLYLIASLVWTTTPLQFAVAMMPNVFELRSARNFIRAELLDSRQDSDSAESVLKRVHAHIVAADIGSCRCNEVFGIVIAGNLFLDLSLISVLLSALQDSEYVQSSPPVLQGL